MERLKYNPALDGIRAIAIIPVLAIHSLAPGTLGGFIGVDIFFVLSGFLITSLLVAEYRDTGRISISTFYLRRARRLYPTLLLVIAAAMILAPYFFPNERIGIEALIAATYLSDYSRAFWDTPRVLQQTWSLAVEEHFYVLWPLVVPWLTRLKNPFKVLILAAALATAWRIFNMHWLGYVETYFRFDTRLSGILLGSALAFAPQVMRLHSVALPLLVIALLMPTTRYASDFGLSAAIMLAEASAILLLGAALNRPSATFLAHPWLVYIGKLSYGLYLWHFPIFLWLRENAGWKETLLIGLPIAFALAALTYHFVDLPIRRHWKIGSHARADPTRVKALS